MLVESLRIGMWFIVIIATILSFVGTIKTYRRWNESDKDRDSVAFIICIFLLGGCGVAIAFLTGLIPKGVLMG